MNNKVLIYDLECSPIVSAVWGYFEQNVVWEESDWYIMSIAYKWEGDKAVKCIALPQYSGYKKNRTSDKALLEDFAKVWNTADTVIAHNGDCVTVDTRVLKSDLTWVTAGELKTGDRLLSFDEGRPPEEATRTLNGEWRKNPNRKIKHTVVTEHNIQKRECLEFTFSNGDKVTTTKSHYWLAMSEKDNNHRWYRAENMRIGQRVIKYFDPWEVDRSYEAGWLSGFIAGEGTLKAECQSIDFCQRPTSTWKQALEYSKHLGLDLSKPKVKVGGLGRGDTEYVYTRGGKCSVLETIGKLQIHRLMEKITDKKLGYLRMKGRPELTIVSIKEVGLKDVAIMETESKTYFAEGFPMHNSFDAKKINARLIINGLMPLKPVAQIDTKKVAKRYFNFPSNKLQYLGDHFGLGGKHETGGYDLWRSCMAGDMKAWAKMIKYNKRDVELLEKVYWKLKPWVQGLYDYNDGCPACGGINFQHRGFKAYKGGQRQRYQCRDCGRWFQDKKFNSKTTQKYI